MVSSDDTRKLLKTQRNVAPVVIACGIFSFLPTRHEFGIKKEFALPVKITKKDFDHLMTFFLPNEVAKLTHIMWHKSTSSLAFASVTCSSLMLVVTR